MTEKKFTDRRTFLKAAGSAGAAAAFAGCTGPGDSGTTTAQSSDRGNETLRNEYELPDVDYELEDTLNVFQWADYWPKGTVAKFEDAYGVDVNVSNYASNEEMGQKLVAGGSDQFDVIFPSDYYLNKLVTKDLVQPLDLGKLTHWDNLETKWVEQAPYDPGSDRYSAPYQWGTSGVGWNADVTPDLDASSWDVLWNEEYADQITVMNDVREAMGMSLKRLGYSLNTKDEDKITEAKEALIQQKDLVLSYDSVNMQENLVNESASPVHTWSGDAFAAYWELYSDGSSPVNYQVPNEGSVVWIDTAAVTKKARHPNAAHAFINFTLNAKINAEITNYVYYPTPNKAAKEYLPDSMLNNERIYPSEDTMKSLEFIRNVGEAQTAYSDAWTEVKNA